VDDVKVWDVLTAILACAEAGLNETSNQAPARSYVAMGEPAHDDCCDGQLVVWFERIYPSAAFPDEDLRPVVCAGAQTAIVVNVEVVRCAPTYDANGNPPSSAALLASARETNVDARAIWTSVLCCLRLRKDEWSAIVNQQAPIGPQGGCVGSRLTVTVGVLDGCECT
jgi:hypothetical protein